jgi:hypothetical protein
MNIVCSCIGSDSSIEHFKSEKLIFCNDCTCDSATESGTELFFNTSINFEISKQKQISINYNQLSFDQKAGLVREYNTEGGGEFDLSWYEHKAGFGFWDKDKAIGFCDISLSISNYTEKAEVFLNVDDVFLLKNYRGQKIGMHIAMIISNEILLSVVDFINQYNKDVKDIVFFVIASCLSQGGEMFCDVMIESSINPESLSFALGGKVNIEMEYDIGD